MSAESESNDTSASRASGGHGQPPAADFAALGPDLTRRITAILEAVEREADLMLHEARAEAEREVDDGRRQAAGPLAPRRRRIAELSDELIVRSEAVAARLEETAVVRESFARLLLALAGAADRISAEIEADGGEWPQPAEPAPVTPAEPAPVVPPEPLDEPLTGPAMPAEWVLRQARQAAIQMAAAGTTRAQVEAHLREFLRVPAPEPLLDQVFGAGTPGEFRVPWGIAPPGEDPLSVRRSTESDPAAAGRRAWRRRGRQARPS